MPSPIHSRLISLRKAFGGRLGVHIYPSYVCSSRSSVLTGSSFGFFQLWLMMGWDGMRKLGGWCGGTSASESKRLFLVRHDEPRRYHHSQKSMFLSFAIFKTFISVSLVKSQHVKYSPMFQARLLVCTKRETLAGIWRTLQHCNF